MKEVKDIYDIELEWWQRQVAARRSIKYIADYLRVPQAHIKAILQIRGLYSLYEEEEEKRKLPKKKQLSFNEVLVGDLVYRNGVPYAVKSIINGSLQVRALHRMVAESVKNLSITQSDWEAEKWRVKRDYAPPTVYKLEGEEHHEA